MSPRTKSRTLTDKESVESDHPERNDKAESRSDQEQRDNIVTVTLNAFPRCFGYLIIMDPLVHSDHQGNNPNGDHGNPNDNENPDQ